MKIDAHFFRGRWHIIRFIESELSSLYPFQQVIFGNAQIEEVPISDSKKIAVTTYSYKESMYCPEKKIRSEQKYNYIFSDEKFFIHFPEDHHHSFLIKDELYVNPLAQFDLSLSSNTTYLLSPSHICVKDLYSYQLAFSLKSKHKQIIHHLSNNVKVKPSLINRLLKLTDMQQVKQTHFQSPAFFIIEIKVSGPNKSYCIYNFMLQDID